MRKNRRKKIGEQKSCNFNDVQSKFAAQPATLIYELISNYHTRVFDFELIESAIEEFDKEKIIIWMEADDYFWICICKFADLVLISFASGYANQNIEFKFFLSRNKNF